MFLRIVTSPALCLSKNRASKIVQGANFCRFCAASLWKKKSANLFRIIKPYECPESSGPILKPLCKVAIVIGGSSGFGYVAADSLLCKGARTVIIAENDFEKARAASKRLCDAHGRKRATFIECETRKTVQFENALQEALKQFKEIHVIFNDLDKRTYPMCSSHNDEKSDAQNDNSLRKIVQTEMKIISKESGGAGGMIVNCSSILGFMGWPEEPTPVYCMKKPTIETTLNLSEEFELEKTGVRLVAMCPTNKTFSTIGLPDFPDPASCNDFNNKPCIPFSKWRIAPALEHILGWAKTGSVWLVEPSPCAYDIPKEIHFPSQKGEKVDPKVYETQPCPVALQRVCVTKGDPKCAKKRCKICFVKKR